MKKEYHFKFEVSMADYEAFNVFVTNQAFKKNRIYRIVIGCGFILFGAYNFYAGGFSFKPDAVIFMAVGLFWVVLLPFLTQRGVKKRAQAIIKSARPGAIIGFRDMIVSEEHIWYKSELYNNTMQWGAIQKVEQMPQHVLLFLAETSALIIPCSEIGDEHAVTEFVSFARQQLDKSQNREEIAAHLIG